MEIIVDISQLSSALAEARIKIDEFAHAAVERVSGQMTQRWRDMVKYAPGLRPDERREYLTSIDWNFDGPASAVVSSSYKNASQIEEGRPAYDMKQMLQTSIKTKISKDGKRYLTIPFRHNTPGQNALAAAMPQSIHNKAKRLTASYHKSYSDPRMNWELAFGRAPRLTEWGGRLGAGLAPKLQQHHKTDPYAGMVRMSGERPTGRKQASQYLTFRTMSESSSGWIKKPQPGLFILRDVAAFTQADTEQMLNELLAEMR